MKNRINPIRYAVWLPATALLLLSGCVKRELEMRPIKPPQPKNGYAEITLDWGDAAVRPKTARYLFYNEEGALVKEVKGLSDGFRDSLPFGKYRLLLHNEDALHVDYRGLENYATAEVFAQETQYTYAFASAGARPTDAATRHDPGMPCILEPQQVYAVGNFTEFGQFVIEAGKTVFATVAPKSLIRQMQFLFEIKGASGVRSLKGVLSGIAPGIFLSTGEHNSASICSMEFTAWPRTRSDEVEYIADIAVFNLLTTADSPFGTNAIEVTLVETDGTSHSATFDLTEVLRDIIGDNSGVIPIEIPVEVVLEVEPLGELTASVRPWDESGSGSGDPRP